VRIEVDHAEKLDRFLAELSEERRADLLHLLDCPICRAGARESLGAEPEDHPRPDYGEIVEAVGARVPALVKRMEEQQAEARRLLDRLLAQPAERQVALARTLEFRSLALADLLLCESEGAQPEDPVRAEGLAGLALPILSQRFSGTQAERIAGFKVRALVLLGNARRLQRGLLEADERFRQAAFHLTGPPDSIERALYCRMLAALRRDQRRYDETAGLLWRAASLYRSNGDVLEEGACLAELGFFYLAEGQVHEALSALERACPLVVLHRDVLFAGRALLALAVCRAGTGRPEPARNLLAVFRSRFLPAADSAQRAEAAWMEGKVALLNGDREDAAALLQMARKVFLETGNLYDAALASLDLVLAFPEPRRCLPALHALLHELAARFPPDLDLAEALRALGAVEMVVAGRVPAPLSAVVALAAERLRRVRRYPQLRSAGPSGAVPAVEAPVLEA